MFRQNFGARTSQWELNYVKMKIMVMVVMITLT